jgi:hypothetical protein
VATPFAPAKDGAESPGADEGSRLEVFNRKRQRLSAVPVTDAERYARTIEGWQSPQTAIVKSTSQNGTLAPVVQVETRFGVVPSFSATAPTERPSSLAKTISARSRSRTVLVVARECRRSSFTTSGSPPRQALENCPGKWTTSRQCDHTSEGHGERSSALCRPRQSEPLTLR